MSVGEARKCNLDVCYYWKTRGRAKRRVEIFLKKKIRKEKGQQMGTFLTRDRIASSSAGRGTAAAAAAAKSESYVSKHFAIIGALFTSKRLADRIVTWNVLI